MSVKNLLLKCVTGRLADALPPTRILRLSELHTLVESDSELVWGLEPKGAIDVRNSDGSFTKMLPHEGFSFVKGERTFCVCYEFYDGIAVHPAGHQRASEKAKLFAISLGAEVFEI